VRFKEVTFLAGASKRGHDPSRFSVPLSCGQERGIKGVRSLEKNTGGEVTLINCYNFYVWLNQKIPLLSHWIAWAVN
jgi:hypothetical protein